MTTLSREQARRFYDRIGSRQDSQGFYEDPPLDELTARGEFGQARAVGEFGCGTGRYALRLLGRELPDDARYWGFELSPNMARLTRRRLASFSDRAAVLLTDGSPALPVADSSLDRVVSNYVLDLLAEKDIRLFLRDAWRCLRPGGRLCLSGLTEGEEGMSRVTSALWRAVHRLRPALVGGCRPVDVGLYLDEGRWRVLHCRTVTAWWVPSQVLVAERRREGGF